MLVRPRTDMVTGSPGRVSELAARILLARTSGDTGQADALLAEVAAEAGPEGLTDCCYAWADILAEFLPPEILVSARSGKGVVIAHLVGGNGEGRPRQGLDAAPAPVQFAARFTAARFRLDKDMCADLVRAIPAAQLQDHVIASLELTAATLSAGVPIVRRPPPGRTL